ncbi:hypothetical protein [Pilimelia columellifera]|uniref:HPt domain-containing protein n=1 Tax=Pilimelia columellifera subsp. columellifera TaxID=706583 RepID=A0ABP6B3I7_9ACTN
MAGVMDTDEMVELLAKFGTHIELDFDAAAADGNSGELIAAKLAHTLVGVFEAHASRADDAARQTGATPRDLADATLGAFAGARCGDEVDEWALLQWRTNKLAMALNELDFGGPFPRAGDVGSGDVLVRTIRATAAALGAMTHAKQISINPLRADGESAEGGVLLARAMDALEHAVKDAGAHRAVGDLMRMVD